MSFASLARVSAFIVVGAFVVGCAQEDVANTKVRDPSVESDDEDAKGTAPVASTPGSTNDDGNVARVVTPSTPPATTTPATKPATKPAIACASDVDSVTQSYSLALQRKPDDGGLQHYVGVIKGGETRLGVLKQILQSTEFTTSREQLTNQEFVVSLYRSFFDRDPDAAGLAGWLNNLNGGGSRSGAAIAFAGSDEFKSPESNRAVACYF